MGNQRKITFLLILLASLLVLTACERSASSGLGMEPNTTGEPTGIVGVGTDAQEYVNIFASQTAIALTEAGGGEPGGLNTPAATTQTVGLTDEPGALTPTFAATVVPPTVEPASCPNPYTVQEGEWVYSIARKCDLDPQAIIDLNGLLWPFTLYPGDVLNLPDPLGTPLPTAKAADCPSPYLVQVGEWVYSIATKCGVTSEAIIEANNLVYPYTIYPGDELIIP